jgi:arginine decarboxylase
MENWNTSRSIDLYRIHDWGSGYFDVNDKGNVLIRPSRNGEACDLYDLVQSLRLRGVEAPILFRFDGIIRDRVKQLQLAFQESIDQWSYNGAYRVTYPIKVNQQSHVVEAVRTAGAIKNLGLEVGSKPELLAVLAVHDLPDAPLLCNGYKDSEYVELALLGRKLGRRSIIIVEQPYELAEILRQAEQLGIEAEIGIRMKPSTRGAGMWQASAGDHAKFGLNTSEILTAIKTLEQQGKLNWLKLLHFHIGSQIPSINSFKKVLREATRMFVEVAKLAPELCFFDIGGGLGVDYDGSNSNFESSMNYTLREYAESVVSAVYEACESAGVRHPDIISESGRALAAHHAVLVMEVIDVSPALYGDAPTVSQSPSSHPLLEKIIELYESVSVKNCVETYHEMIDVKDGLIEQFNSGNLNLEERAFAERTLRHLFHKLNALKSALKFIPEELEKIDGALRDTYFCNFSVFQSMPDSWAIDQLFPIIPIHRLQEEPTKRAILADLTCDSDGEITRFIDLKDVNNYLTCHSPKEDQPYFLGVFLIGAYQEILGDLHNLFGDTNAVHVNITEDGSPEITHVVRGDTVREVLEYVEYDAGELLNRFRLALERAIRNGDLSPEDSARIQKRYRDALDGYTYLVK